MILIYIILVLLILFIIYFINLKKKYNFDKTKDYYLSIKNNNIKPYLWLYWDNLDNKEDPPIIDLCFQTVLKHCSESFEIKRLNKDTIKLYLPDLEEIEKYLSNLKIAHKVDIYRIMLLKKYGGMYLDSDIIVMKNPIELLDKLEFYDFIGFGCTGQICKYGYGSPSNWLLISRPETELMGNILNTQLNKLIEINKDNKIISYHELGKLIIWKELENLINKKNYIYYHYPNTIDGTRDKYGKWVFNDRIFSDKKIEYNNAVNDLFFMVLYNSELEDEIKNMSKYELLNTNTNFRHFINLSLKKI